MFSALIWFSLIVLPWFKILKSNRPSVPLKLNFRFTKKIILTDGTIYPQPDLLLAKPMITNKLTVCQSVILYLQDFNTSSYRKGTCWFHHLPSEAHCWVLPSEHVMPQLGMSTLISVGHRLSSNMWATLLLPSFDCCVNSMKTSFFSTHSRYVWNGDCMCRFGLRYSRKWLWFHNI